MKNLDRDPMFLLVTVFVLLPAIAVVETLLFFERCKAKR